MANSSIPVTDLHFDYFFIFVLNLKKIPVQCPGQEATWLVTEYGLSIVFQKKLNVRLYVESNLFV